MLRLILLSLIEVVAVALLIECATAVMHAPPIHDPYRPAYALLGLYISLLVLLPNTWNIVRQIKYMANS